MVVNMVTHLDYGLNSGRGSEGGGYMHNAMQYEASLG